MRALLAFQAGWWLSFFFNAWLQERKHPEKVELWKAEREYKRQVRRGERLDEELVRLTRHLIDQLAELQRIVEDREATS